MVMITRNAYKKACESSNSSDISEKNIIPPWCSSASTGKVYERKPRRAASRWEIQSSYPIRENIWDYLYEDCTEHNFSYKRKRVKQPVVKAKVKPGVCRTSLILLLFVLVSLGLLLSLWITNSITRVDLITKVIPKAKLISLFGIQSSVTEECCNKMRFLESKLARAEEILRKSIRLRRVLMLSSRPKVVSDKVSDRRYIEGATATKGSDTEEWGGRVALWGVVPLWRAAPPPDTILALRNPTPSDCWPFSGSEGEIVIQLPQMKSVNYISVEHVYPDTAQSAPKEFVLYGVLGNDTWIKVVDGQYHNKGPAKQYYSLANRKAPMKSIVFRVLSNHGNPKYTCVYRVHLYESVNELTLFWV